ncbi:hypothetical protein R9C00_19865 [Flammeovirgaceae bacterium SG7u.111]|nr:hypothetical protein [Flammeovirgaceae bacterium SG7u.132]WPO33957.1 hypothetical protein R9C00_19865 [Flammeovirgaceae bacterium SG7u.111]
MSSTVPNQVAFTGYCGQEQYYAVIKRGTMTSDEKIITFTDMRPPKPTAVSSQTNICSGPIYLEVTGAPSGGTYQWYDANDNPITLDLCSCIIRRIVFNWKTLISFWPRGAWATQLRP